MKTTLSINKIEFIEGRLNYFTDKVNVSNSKNFDWKYYDSEVNELEWLLVNLLDFKMTREQFLRLEKSFKKIKEIQSRYNLFNSNVPFELAANNSFLATD